MITRSLFSSLFRLPRVAKGEKTDSDSDVCLLEELPPPAKKRQVSEQEEQVASPLRGPRLSDFELVSTIGKGGFGSVFLVRPIHGNAGTLHLDKDGFYALKAIRKNRLRGNRYLLYAGLSPS